MKETIKITSDYLNNISLRKLPGFFFPLIFLGWNGVQIVFSLGLILTFINTKSMTNLVLNSMRYYARAIPIYVFAIVTFFFLFLFLHCLFETKLAAKLNGVKLKMSELRAIAVNSFVPNLIIVLLVFFLVGIVFLLMTFSQIVSGGFDANLNLAVEYSLYRWLYFSILISVAITIFLSDNVIPRMIKHHSFKGAYTRAYICIRNNLRMFALYYLLKVLLILFTVFIFQSILRHFLLPYFWLLEDKFSFNLFLLSSRTISFRHIVTNILLFYAIILSVMVVFVPIMAFPYYYLRLLLFKWTNY